MEEKIYENKKTSKIISKIGAELPSSRYGALY